MKKVHVINILIDLKFKKDKIIHLLTNICKYTKCNYKCIAVINGYFHSNTILIEPKNGSIESIKKKGDFFSKEIFMGN